MRTLSLADCIQLNFSGSILKNGLGFGDVDNDGLNEFVIGSLDGNLAIFRDRQSICSAIDLGEICGIVIGDLLNIERNVLAVVSTDGWCHVFDVEKELELIQQQLAASNNEKSASTTGASTSVVTTADFPTSVSVSTMTPNSESSYNDAVDSPTQFLQADYTIITPFHSQRIPPNIKTMHLGDVNGDGMIELIVGLTDRVLRTYQWKVETREANISVFTSGSLLRAYYENPIYEGRLVALNKWEFPSQICSTSLFHKNESTVSILISQPGGNVTEISEILKEKMSPDQQHQEDLNLTRAVSSNKLSFEQSMSGQTSATVSSAASTSTKSGYIPRNIARDDNNQPTPAPSSNSNTRIIIEHHDLYPTDEERRNKHITSEIIGNIKSMNELDENSDCYAVATLDGTVLIARNNKILWKLEVEQQIFGLAEINGKLLTCSWSGETYLIDSKESVKFNFDESVSTFAAGMYGACEDFYAKDSKIVNQFCVAYVSFNEKIYIYPVDPSIL